MSVCTLDYRKIEEGGYNRGMGVLWKICNMGFELEEGWKMIGIENTKQRFVGECF